MSHEFGRHIHHRHAHAGQEGCGRHGARHEHRAGPDAARCGCGCHEHGRHGAGHGQGCHTGGFRRMFVTRQERIAWLQQYLEALEAEAQAVRERIEDLEARSGPAGAAGDM